MQRKKSVIFGDHFHDFIRYKAVKEHFESTSAAARAGFALLEAKETKFELLHARLAKGGVQLENSLLGWKSGAHRAQLYKINKAIISRVVAKNRQNTIYEKETGMIRKISVSKVARTYMVFAFLMTGFLGGCERAETRSFTGTIESTARAKHVPSLCSSLTFTRFDNGQQFGVQFQSGTDDTFLAQFADKIVEIDGSFVTKERKFNALEQRPVNMNGQPEQITCHYFSVSEIRIAP